MNWREVCWGLEAGTADSGLYTLTRRSVYCSLFQAFVTRGNANPPATSLCRVLGDLHRTWIVNKFWSQKRDQWHCWKPISSLSRLNNFTDNRKRTSSFLACHPTVLHMHTFDMNPQSVTLVVWLRVFTAVRYTIVVPIFCTLTSSHFVYAISQQLF